MPSESMPRILRGPIVSSGNFAPIVATAIVCPAATLVAAVAIVRRRSVPTSIEPTCNLSALGCFSSVTILPTTTPVTLRTTRDLRNRKTERRETVGD